MPVRTPKRPPARARNTTRCANWTVDEIVHRPIEAIDPYARNVRRHSDAQIALVAGSIRTFGFLNPILVDRDDCIVAGHCRHAAAQRLGLETVPTIRADHLTPAQIRAYRITDNCAR